MNRYLIVHREIISRWRNGQSTPIKPNKMKSDKNFWISKRTERRPFLLMRILIKTKCPQSKERICIRVAYRSKEDIMKINLILIVLAAHISDLCPDPREQQQEVCGFSGEKFKTNQNARFTTHKIRLRLENWSILHVRYEWLWVHACVCVSSVVLCVQCLFGVAKHQFYDF